MTGEGPKLKLIDGEGQAPAAAPPPHELDWSIMMARAQTGDRDAYRRLLGAIAPYLHARARGRLGSAEEAEDAVQDILLTIHAARRSYDPARPFGPWLAAIADRRIIDRLRRRNRRHKLHEAATLDEPEQKRAHDRAVLDARALDAAIASLPPEQARAIRLLKIEERSLAESAAQTGQSVGALKAAAHRAMKTLRRRLFEGTPR